LTPVRRGLIVPVVASIDIGRRFACGDFLIRTTLRASARLISAGPFISTFFRLSVNPMSAFLKAFSPATDAKELPSGVVPPAVSMKKPQSKRKTGKEDRKKIASIPKPLVLASSGAASSVGLSSYLVDPDHIYTFRLVGISTLSASVNTILNVVNLDPTASAEWSSLIAIFSFYRTRSARLTVVPLQNGNSGTNSRPYAIVSPDPGLYNTPPSNAFTCFDGAAARMFSLAPGMPHKDYQFELKNLMTNWASTSSPIAQPYAGHYGQFTVYAQTVGASDGVQYGLELVVEFTNRT